jgi:hypothetical protein
MIEIVGSSGSQPTRHNLPVSDIDDFIMQGALFRDKNTNHILQFDPQMGLVHNETLCKEITGCIDFQKNN